MTLISSRCTLAKRSNRLDLLFLFLSQTTSQREGKSRSSFRLDPGSRITSLSYGLNYCHDRIVLQKEIPLPPLQRRQGEDHERDP